MLCHIILDETEKVLHSISFQPGQLFFQPRFLLKHFVGRSYLGGQFHQIKRSWAEHHAEISFWFGKGDIPNEKIRLPPLEVHFGVGGCGRTDSAGGAGQE